MFLLQLEAGYKSSGIHLAAKVNLPFQFNYCGANSINICKSEVTSPKNAKRNALMIWNQQMLRSFLVQSPWLTLTSSLQAGPRWWSSGHNVRVKINRSWVWSSYQPVLYSCDPALQICMVLELGDKVSFTCAVVGKNYLKRVKQDIFNYWSQDTLGLDSTWIGDILGAPGACWYWFGYWCY